MACLVLKNRHYYAQFYDTKRRPKQKQISLKTRTRRVALRLLVRLEDEYALGTYDPWAESLEKSNHNEKLKALGDAAKAFTDTRRHCSPHTIRRYEVILGLLTRHLGSDYPTRRLGTKEIQQFLDATPRKPDTMRSYSNSLKAFCNWLIEEGVLATNPLGKILLPRLPLKHPRFLKPVDVERLVEAIERAINDNPKATHDAGTWLIPIIRANVYLGLRASELVNLLWEHVDLERRTLTVANTKTFRTKNARDRTLPLCEAVYGLLVGLERRSPFVFPNYGGTQLHAQYLSRRFKHYARKAGLPEAINFHSTRHTACSWLAVQGASVEAIRMYAGHSSIVVTQKYMHLSANAFFDQINRAFESI